jgi:hypothetical protein
MQVLGRVPAQRKMAVLCVGEEEPQSDMEDLCPVVTIQGSGPFQPVGWCVSDGARRGTHRSTQPQLPQRVRGPTTEERRLLCRLPGWMCCEHSEDIQ